jgi:hypothetical protein
MTNLSFEVEGSKGDVYSIKAGTSGDGNVWITCSCPAGDNGLYCKHRFALIHGDISDLLSDNDDDVERLQALLAGSDIEAWLHRIVEWEERVAAAKAELAKVKRGLARSMHD